MKSRISLEKDWLEKLIAKKVLQLQEKKKKRIKYGFKVQVSKTLPKLVILIKIRLID